MKEINVSLLPKSFLLLLTFVVLLTASLARAEKDIAITKIIFDGLSRIDEKEVRAAITTIVGNAPSKERIRDDVKAIYALGHFSDVRVDLNEEKEGIVLTFLLKERPLIASISFEGNKDIKSKKLLKESGLKEGDSFDPYALIEAERKITAYYKEKGYLSTCKAETKETENGVEITFKISQEEIVKIKQITFKGNEVFSSWRLRWKMDIGKGDAYDESKLKQDLAKIADLYRDEGYALVEIPSPDTSLDPEGKGILVNIEIKEGKQFKWGGITSEGNTLFSEKELLEALEIKSGTTYSLSKIQQGMAKMDSLYAQLGYIGVRIFPQPDFNQEAARVDLHLKVMEGEQAYIERILVSGNEKTKEKVIRREIVVKEGEVFDRERVRLSRQKIFQLGFFSKVDIEMMEGSAPNKKVLGISVEERRTGTAGASIGYSNQDGLIGSVELTHENLMGRAWRANLTLEFGGALHRYILGFTNPYFMDTTTSLGFDIYDTRRKERDEGDYVEGRRGGGIKIGRRFGDFNKVFFDYKLEGEMVDNVDPNTIDEDIKDHVDRYGEGKWGKTSSIANRLIRDTRDNPFNTTSGYQVILRNEFAGTILGGNNNFYKPSLEVVYFLPTWWKFVLAFRTKMALIDSIKADPSRDVPALEKFRLGGANTIRGYQEQTIHPERGRGKSMLLLNVEARFPIVSPLAAALFLDAGNTWEEIEDFELNDLKHGCGFGLRFDTPMGLIRLDYGYALDEVGSIEKGHRKFHFSIGSIF
ncbi:MAG: outer membrane protein assembly factor BamA [bacterium]|nr:outer membrane protein assembly factor BamA [bacterium]